jgi:hypothetical protein
MATPDSTKTPSPSSSPSPKKRKPPAKTPFDNPWLLPVLCAGFAVWSGYDGWLNPKMEWVKFNRGLFGVSLLGFLWTLRQALQDQKRQRAKARITGTGAPPL